MLELHHWEARGSESSQEHRPQQLQNIRRESNRCDVQARLAGTSGASHVGRANREHQGRVLFRARDVKDFFGKLRTIHKASGEKVP